jgi:hypothetical protein
MSDTIFLDPNDADTRMVPREKVNPKEKWIKHVHCGGARFHTLSYGRFLGIDGRAHAEVRCSEPDCVYNKPREYVE